MRDDDPALQPLLAHLYGSAIARPIAELAKAEQGERVIMPNAEPGERRDWPLRDLPTEERGEYIVVPDPRAGRTGSTGAR